MALIRWPKRCEYARVTVETKARTGQQKLARVIPHIEDKEARRLAADLMVELAVMAELMRDAKAGESGTWENGTAGAINTSRTLETFK